MKNTILLLLLTTIGLSANAQDSTGCDLSANFTYTILGETLYLTNTSTDEPADPSYLWYVDGLSSELENPSFSTADFETSEEVCLTVIDSLAECTDTYCMTLYFDADTLDDSTLCEVDVDFTFVRSAETIYFTNTSTSEPADPLYRWYLDGWPVSTEENPSFDVSEFEFWSTMCLEVYNADWSCYDSTCQVIMIDSIGIDSTASINQSEKMEAAIFPNPAQDHINITIANTNGGQNIIIYNPIGEVVRLEQLSYNMNRTTIDISSLPDGMYIIEIIDTDNPTNRYREKLMKN